jgi:thymidylate synthase (FAD)
MSRSATHQIVRHRKISPSQSSQRYIDYGKKEFRYIMPPLAEKEDPVMWKADVEASYNAYLYWKHIGLKPEDARELLPNAAISEIVITSTIDNWIHIFNQRSRNPKAQWQVKEVVQEVETHMRNILPSVLGD